MIEEDERSESVDEEKEETQTKQALQLPVGKLDKPTLKAKGSKADVSSESEDDSESYSGKESEESPDGKKSSKGKCNETNQLLGATATIPRLFVVVKVQATVRERKNIID